MSPVGLALSVLIGVALGFFGGGGSILTVPLLVYVFGRSPAEAVATSLLVVGTASLAAGIAHWRDGNVQLRTAAVFGSAGMAGAYLGGRAAAFFDGEILLLLFAAMMVLTSLAMWRGRRAEPEAGAPRSDARILAQGVAAGLLTGLVGAGGGFLIVPALVLWAGLPMPAAVGTSLLIIVLNCAAGFLGHLGHAPVDPLLVASVSAAAIGGSLVGARLAARVDPRSLRRGFASAVLAMAAFIVVREADRWLGAARQALPESAPQLVFALLVLGVGVAAGRASARGAVEPFVEQHFERGGGI
jgi:hypothetical protein